MPAKRIIACLDVSGGRVVKGVKFRDHIDLGDPAALACAYRDEGADEIVIYDITASPERRTLDLKWLEGIARRLDVPLCVAGGISSVAQAVACLEHGADKISINSAALARPDLIEEIAELTGSQCVVVGVDSRWTPRGWEVFRNTGKVETTEATARLTLDWIEEAQSRGAGEIVLNCMDRDGTRGGFDLEQLRAARARLSIPLVASGGAGTPDDFVAAFLDADVSGALAASILHTGAVRLGAIKQAVHAAGVEVRP